MEILRALLPEEVGTVAIDLKNVSLVDRDAVQLLALTEYTGVDLRNCPPYIREWVTRERRSKGPGEARVDMDNRG